MLTKFLRRQKPRVEKCWRILLSSAKSTAADFSQTSLKISYVTQMVLSRKVWHCNWLPHFYGWTLCLLFSTGLLQSISQILGIISKSSNVKMVRLISSVNRHPPQPRIRGHHGDLLLLVQGTPMSYDQCAAEGGGDRRALLEGLVAQARP